MILRYGIARRRPEYSVDRAVVITQLGKLCLDGANRRIAHRLVAIYVLVIVVWFYVCIVAGIVIVRVIVVGVVRVVIPREKTIIQATPEAVDKDKEAMVIKVGMPPVPVPVPVAVVTFGDVANYAIESWSLARCSALARR